MADAQATLLVRNLFEVFGERDPAKRLNAIADIFVQDAIFYEGDERFEGHAAINAKVEALLTTFPATFTFTTVGTAARNHDIGRLHWRLGPAGAPPVASGLDIARFRDGRIQALYVFLDDSGSA